ncbi:TetR/AcrR family transcriptional regulator [Evansella tamaricis]|uniref:TetR/AcrR family transcriptional regulator n=1 Tax=Evansella tamaricis TaxID=2069301 RepID=A0ABS6JHB9_9BACI|nr:TetR/AcrR family transcriptional regulator [Evansella tamaricis]MBU9713065.1 TetR/AcrR family transcriptional regulator [Evansella tamaricis]
MINKNQQKSTLTKERILNAAKKLFAEKGFSSVTIREIAKEAGCSHTAIYIYYKDKETLLEKISIPPLESLYHGTKNILEKETDPLLALKVTCSKFVEFGISNRNMYLLYSTTRGERVDLEKTRLEVNQLRNQIFNLLRLSLKQVLIEVDEQELLTISRIVFYQVHGVIMTYIESNEPVESILERIYPVVSKSVELIVRGFESFQKDGE